MTSATRVSATAVPTQTLTAALPTITIMEPRQFHSTPGHFSPMMVQVVCSVSSMSRMFRTKRIAREYVAGVVASGKAVFVAQSGIVL